MTFLANPALALTDDADFKRTSLFKLLADKPLSIIDVGARAGVHEMFEPLGKLARVLAFEPDEEAYAELVADKSLQSRFAEVIIKQDGLGDGRRVPFYLLSKATNHSLLPPNEVLVDRYKMELFRLTGQIEIDTKRLDDVVSADPKLADFGEIIKIDTQGSEHLIFEHAQHVLSRNTAAVFCEVWFCEIYQGQKLFHELCAQMQAHGLRFYGFPSFFLRSGKRLDKATSLGRERALYADALFIKDPIERREPAPAPRELAAIVVAALLTGYFDFALELVETYMPDDRAAILAVVNRLAKADAKAMLAAWEQSRAAAIAEPFRAMIHAGHFADRFRPYFDYGDCS